jgi:hypothetical protein
MPRLYGATCAGCNDVLLRGPDDAAICADCMAREEVAPR